MEKIGRMLNWWVVLIILFCWYDRIRAIQDVGVGTKPFFDAAKFLPKKDSRSSWIISQNQKRLVFSTRY